MKVILIGYGNVGKNLEEVLKEQGVAVDLLVSSRGVFAAGSKIDAVGAFAEHISPDSFVFISVPSIGKGEEMRHYYEAALEKGAKVVTCEKAVLAYHWELVEKYRDRIRHSATVGGNSGILPAISSYEDEILELKAILNGTLNYVADAFVADKNETDIFREVVERGFSDPGSNNLQEVFENELKDVAYKTAILANHSRLFGSVFTPDALEITPYKKDRRCVVLMRKDHIEAGFIGLKDTAWFSKGVNNCLYINGMKAAEGPGAGGKITAKRMFKDFQELAL